MSTDHHWDPGSQLLLWQETPSLPSLVPTAKSGRSPPARTSRQSESEPSTWHLSVPGWTGPASGTYPYNPHLYLRYHPGCQCLRWTDSDKCIEKDGQDGTLRKKWRRNKESEHERMTGKREKQIKTVYIFTLFNVVERVVRKRSVASIILHWSLTEPQECVKWIRNWGV